MGSFYDDASWVLIPSGIKEDVIYAQKPSSGLGDLTMTRASDATYTDSTGVVRRSPYNLVQFSEEFDNAYWTKVKGGVALAPVVTANVELAPNGTMTADRIVFDLNGGTSGSDFSQLRSGSFIYSSDTRTQSIYLRTTDNTNKVFTYVSPTGSQTSITVTPTYQRFTFTSTGVGSDTIRLRLLGAGEGTATSATVAAWGAQFVEGTSALDYFPTTNRQDVPRIDFRNADGTLSSCGRLLLEPQRTNRVLYSEQFDNAAWVKSVATVTANTTISPDGNQNADTIAFTASAIAFCQQIVAGAFESQSHTVSVYAKVASGTATFRLKCTHGGVTDYFSSDFTATTTWQRFTFTATFGATIGTSIVCGVINGTNALAKNVIFYGFQTEANASYATTYIPTTTAAVTRIADAASKTGVSSIIGQTEGTLFVEVNTTVLGSIFLGFSRRFLSVSNNTLNNRIIIFQSLVDDSIQLTVTFGGVTQVAITGAANQSGIKKIAAAYANNDFVLYVNGVQIGTDTSGTVPTCDRVAVGYETDLNSSNPACPVAQAALFPTRLTNAQLAQLTTL